MKTYDDKCFDLSYEESKIINTLINVRKYLISSKLRMFLCTSCIFKNANITQITAFLSALRVFKEAMEADILACY